MVTVRIAVCGAKSVTWIVLFRRCAVENVRYTESKHWWVTRGTLACRARQLKQCVVVLYPCAVSNLEFKLLMFRRLAQS